MKNKLWGITLLGEFEEGEIDYFKQISKNLPDIHWVWREMDAIWVKYKLNNKIPLEDQNIGVFYSHPIWLVNGIFTYLDEKSIANRAHLANYVKRLGVKNVADFGGGSGSLAKCIIETDKECNVHIIEPYPISHFKKSLEKENKISFKKDLSADYYDCIIAQDVLEHVDNPLEIVYKLASNVKNEGFLIFANCFYPVIECHIPSTFYLRYLFKYSLKLMGLKYVGVVEEVPYALVFKKTGSLKYSRLIRLNPILKIIGNILNTMAEVVIFIKSKI